MLGKCLATSLFLFFLCLAVVFYNSYTENHIVHRPNPKLILSSVLSSCSIDLNWTSLGPSPESFIQASITDEGRELRFPGLAVTSTLKNACQPLTDVSKAKIPANKIALVILQLEDETACPMQDLALEAQRAGYSVLIYFAYSVKINTTAIYVPSKEILLIPVLEASLPQLYKNNDVVSVQPCSNLRLTNRKRTNVEINIQVFRPFSKELNAMKSYLDNLYCWFFVGPIITLEWMRRTKKFCWHSGRHERSENPLEPEAENQVETDVEREIRTMEEGEHRTGEPVQLLACRERPAEEQPLLSAVSNDSRDNRCRPKGSGSVKKYHSVCDKAAIGFGYLILVLAALPVGLSTGGLSFFRFDSNILVSSTASSSSVIAWRIRFLYVEFPVWWSPFQIFCFFMYSHLVCRNERISTWTIPTNFSKLIRNDWFASNIYLLVLGVVEPFCFLSGSVGIRYFLVPLALCNSINTVCNFLFLIILNKHKVVTCYVFYISVCMICAYIESDVVALFYFALNSQGSLRNVKLTAIRTAAITLTLIVSFRTSMHIIRKLINPRQSLFEGLSEQ